MWIHLSSYVSSRLCVNLYKNQRHFLVWLILKALEPQGCADCRRVRVRELYVNHHVRTLVVGATPPTFDRFPT